MSKYLYLLLISFLYTSCANPPLNTKLDPSWQVSSYKDYKNAVHKNTKKVSKYEGFYNVFDISVTKLSKDIQIKQLKIEANYSQWSVEKAEKERQKLVDSLAKDTVFFVSAFTPKRDLNSLSLEATGWNATLEMNGTEYPGKFTNYNNKPYKLENLYEHYTIWHKGYLLKFDVPSDESDNIPQKITLSSPYGFAIYKFNQDSNKN